MASLIHLWLVSCPVLGWDLGVAKAKVLKKKVINFWLGSMGWVEVEVNRCPMNYNIFWGFFQKCLKKCSVFFPDFCTTNQDFRVPRRFCWILPAASYWLPCDNWQTGHNFNVPFPRNRGVTRPCERKNNGKEKKPSAKSSFRPPGGGVFRYPFGEGKFERGPHDFYSTHNFGVQWAVFFSKNMEHEQEKPNGTHVSKIILHVESIHKIHHLFLNTLPKTNIAPENRQSQKETRIPTIHFQALLLFVSGRGYHPPEALKSTISFGGWVFGD